MLLPWWQARLNLVRSYLCLKRWTSGIMSASSDYLAPPSSSWTTHYHVMSASSDYCSPLAKLIDIKMESYTETLLADTIQLQNLDAMTVTVFFAPKQIYCKLVLFPKSFCTKTMRQNGTISLSFKCQQPFPKMQL